MSDEEIARVDYYLAFIQCALQHPVVPRGLHVFDDKIKIVPSVLEIYPVIFRLYDRVEDSRLFREPVNALENEILDYYSVVQKPMSLREVLTRAHRGDYSNAEQLLADVALIWKNCALYNGPDHVLTKQAQRCEQWLATELQRIEDDKDAPQEQVHRFRIYVEENSDDELVRCVLELVQRDAPGLIVDGELELAGMKRGLLRHLMALIEDHAQGKPLSVGKKRGRATPQPGPAGGGGVRHH